MAKGFANLKPRVGNEDAPRIEDLVEVLKFRDKEWTAVRFLEQDILSLGVHWLRVKNKEGRVVSFPKQCVGWDRENEDLHKEKCPYCKAGIRLGNEYWAMVIDREAQENEPTRKAEPTKAEKKTGFKEKDSKSWTPVRYVRLTGSLAQKIQRLADINKVKGEKKDVADEEYGIDIQIYFDSKAAGTDKYQVQKGERTPLTDEEKEYLLWNLTSEMVPVESKAEAQDELDRIVLVDEKGTPLPGQKGYKADDDEEDYEEEDLADEGDDPPPPRKGKGKPKPVDDDDLDEDDEDDEPPQRPAKKGKARPVDDEDDLDDDPPPRKGKGKPVKGDDEDDLDLDEDDDPPPRKGKGKPKPVDDDDLDEDDEDDPPPRKGKSKPATKKGKPVDDDDDFSDLDDDEDD